MKSLVLWVVNGFYSYFGIRDGHKDIILFMVPWLVLWTVILVLIWRKL